MTSGAIPQPSLSTRARMQTAGLPGPIRVLAGILGGVFVAVFLHEAVRHPAEGWLSAILCGVPMVWLIQGARTGRAQNWDSVGWFAAWYAVFASAWLAASALERPGPGWGLSAEAGLGVFLGSIVLVGGASSFARYREALPIPGRRPSPGQALGSP